MLNETIVNDPYLSEPKFYLSVVLPGNNLQSGGVNRDAKKKKGKPRS